MKKINIAAYLIMILLLMNACDIIEPPYEEGSENQVNKPKKNILIEDFTGFRCGSCPPAAVEADRIMNEYPGRVFTLGIHVGTLAEPTQTYTYDFRSKAGSDIDQFFGISSIGTPLGLINRTKFKNDMILTYPKWANAVEDILEQTSDIEIKLNASYNEANSTITVNPTLIYFENIKNTHNFNIYITESKIIEYQKWYNHNPDDIYDYEHNHVLRDGFYGAWGREVNSLFEGSDTLNAELSYTITNDKDWNPDNLSLIGVVMDSQNNYEILQVQEIYLK